MINKKLLTVLTILILFLLPSVLFAESHYTTVTNASELEAVFTNSNLVWGDAYYVNIANDIVTDKKIDVSKYGEYHILGQGHTITFRNNDTTTASADHAISFSYPQRQKRSLIGSIEDLTIKVENGFRGGVAIITNQTQEGSAPYYNIRFVLRNVSVMANRSEAPLKEKKGKLVEATSVLLQNNASRIVLDGSKCSFVTDKYCWAAINVDSTYTFAHLNIEEDTEIEFVDNRDEFTKCVEPIMKFEKHSGDVELRYKDAAIGDTAPIMQYIEDIGKTIDPDGFFGYKLKGQHMHGDWSYEAEGNTLYAKCGAEGTCPLENSKVSLSVFAPSEMKLSVWTKPGKAREGLVSWTSSNLNIATVDANGTVKAVGTGEVTISADSVRGKKFKDSIKVNVQ